MSQITTFFCKAGTALVLPTALALSACGGGSSDAPLDNHVTTASGPVVGNAADSAGILSFKGIPFAAPPVGNLRWKEPQAVAPWTTARDATQLSARCWGAAAFGGTVGASEDCLYLNVWSGAATRGAKLPVMVWLHGGGFQFGSAIDPDYDGAALAKKGVIVVSLNYRLGVFGFLSNPDLDAESGGHQSGMYGMEDQLAALQWVKANIAAFGGDPSNVTLFGESAGAHAVGLLMASPLSAGLFHKAIGESGAYWESEMKSHPQAQAYAAALSTQLNAPTLAALRAVPAAQLEAATAWNLTLPTKFSPTVDGYVLPELPYLRFKAGRQNDVPLLAGWNAAEGFPFMAYSLPHDTAQHFIDAATQTFGSAHMASFSQLYPATSDVEAAASAQTLVGDLTIRYQTWTWANQQRSTGHKPVYVYNFNFTSAYTPVASHLNEVAYVFGNFVPGPFHGFPPAPTAADLAVSSAMQTYWTNFARTGNPNGSGVPAWPQYTGAGGQAMLIGNTPVAGVEDGTARYQFLDTIRGSDGLIPQGDH